MTYYFISNLVYKDFTGLISLEDFQDKFKDNSYKIGPIGLMHLSELVVEDMKIVKNRYENSGEVIDADKLLDLVKNHKGFVVVYQPVDNPIMNKHMNTDIMQYKIDQIMDNFDFNKVHKVMIATDWKWVFTDGVPTEAELRQQARKMLKEVSTKNITDDIGDYYISTGGFTVTKYSDTSLTLEFIVSSWEE